MRDPLTTAYMLGDLDARYEAFCTWYGAGPEEASELDGVVLLYTGLRLPTLLAYGQSGAVAAVLEQFASQLPRRVVWHSQPHHASAIDAHYRYETQREMTRMGLVPQDFQPVAESRFEVEPLTHRHTGEIMDLYQYYPDNFFEPAQLGTGHYYGIHQDGSLVSVAGVHVWGPGQGVAVLGNIVTHPDYRGLGLSTACTSHLCTQLISSGSDVLALNVQQSNHSAVRVYEKLGFRYHDTYVEGLADRVGP